MRIHGFIALRTGHTVCICVTSRNLSDPSIYRYQWNWMSQATLGVESIWHVESGTSCDGCVNFGKPMHVRSDQNWRIRHLRFLFHWEIPLISTHQLHRWKRHQNNIQFNSIYSCFKHGRVISHSYTNYTF